MKRRLNWQVTFACILIVLSIILYVCHYLIFKDGHRIFLDLLEYIAFIPVQVLLVTLVIDKLLRVREKRTLLKKLNMVIGVFFSEVGMDLVRRFLAFESNRERLSENLILSPEWTGKQFLQARKAIKDFGHELDLSGGGLVELGTFLEGKKYFLLRLLENPNLLEHESFTNLLWAVTHLAEELSFREGLTGLPQEDLGHLSGDIKRVYTLLISEWLVYMSHLHGAYPYLYSLAVRTNPFNPNAKAGFGG